MKEKDKLKNLDDIKVAIAPLSYRNRANRAKGHSFERQVANQLREIYPDARRGLQYQDGSIAPDVVIGDYWVECKRSARNTQPKTALDQAIEACSKAKSDKVPITVTKDDRRDALVTMRFSDFLELLIKLKKENDNGEKNSLGS